MATIIPATTFPQHGVAQTVWSGFAASGDVGRAETLARYPVKSVQITGTFTGAPTIILESSEDGVNFFQTVAEYTASAASATPGDVAVSATAAAYFGNIQDNPQFIRPRATAGAGGANVVVTLVAKTFGN